MSSTPLDVALQLPALALAELHLPPPLTCLPQHGIDQLQTFPLPSKPGRYLGPTPLFLEAAAASGGERLSCNGAEHVAAGIQAGPERRRARPPAASTTQLPVYPFARTEDDWRDPFRAARSTSEPLCGEACSLVSFSRSRRPAMSWSRHCPVGPLDYLLQILTNIMKTANRRYNDFGTNSVPLLQHGPAQWMR